MSKAIYIVSVLLLATMASCDKAATLYYKITNIASDSVDVVRTLVDGTEMTDTFRIGFNQQVTIAVTDAGLNHVSTYKETGDTLRGFTKILVYKKHTQLSKTDFRLTSQWTYNELGKHKADYTTTVSDKDF
jgi:hypothetical protein